MDMQTAIRSVTEGHDLSIDQMSSVMHLIMTGNATPAQIGGFLIGLRMKGETVDEITAATGVMRELAVEVEIEDAQHLVDTCGTGGDASQTFNISTACAFVVAAAGGKVAKHGNRSISSKSGSADVLELAGVKLNLSPIQIAQCIDEVGVGFLFAPAHHAAMKHAIGPRKEMGVRTIFNLLGPLTNPAGAKNQVIGVFAKNWQEPFVQVLKRLGSRHVMVVYAEDGLDEISVGAATQVVELQNGKVSTYRIEPKDFDYKKQKIDDLQVDSPEQSLQMINSAFANKSGAAKDAVCLNAGAAIYVAGISNDLGSGVQTAERAIAEGTAAAKLSALVNLTRRM